MRNSQGPFAHGQWTRLDIFLWTDLDDLHCNVCRDGIDIYAEIIMNGADPALHLPAIAAHLLLCENCREDLAGLVSTLSDEAGRS